MLLPFRMFTLRDRTFTPSPEGLRSRRGLSRPSLRSIRNSPTPSPTFKPCNPQIFGQFLTDPSTTPFHRLSSAPIAPLSIPQCYASFWSYSSSPKPFLFMGFRPLSIMQGVYPPTRHPSPRLFFHSLAIHHASFATIPFRSNTYKAATKETTLSIFRINTYEKTRGEGRLCLTSPLPTTQRTHYSPQPSVDNEWDKENCASFATSGITAGRKRKHRPESPPIQRQE
jgi:hypothetical protein